MWRLFIKWFLFYFWLPITFGAIISMAFPDRRWSFTIWFPLLIFSGVGLILTAIGAFPFAMAMGPISFLLPLVYLGVLISCLIYRPTHYKYPWVGISLVVLICSASVTFAICKYRTSQPIQVISATKTPLPGITLQISNNDPLWPRSDRVVTDENGKVTITGYPFERLNASVVNNDYYVMDSERRLYFEFNESQKQRTLPLLTFHLRKKGQAESLITFNKNFSVSISKKPLDLNLKTGKIAPSGQGNVILEFFRTPPDEKKSRIYDWSFKITIPNGGLVLSTNEFDFTAPEKGYESMENIEMPASLGEKWQGRFNRRYFLKFSDATYGRALFDLMPHNGSLKIEAFINPSGSRNLEFDPDKAIRPE